MMQYTPDINYSINYCLYLVRFNRISILQPTYDSFAIIVRVIRQFGNSTRQIPKKQATIFESHEKHKRFNLQGVIIRIITILRNL